MVNFKIDDEFKIVSTKHNGSLHRSWEKNTVFSYKDGILIGGNDATLVYEADGKVWRTTEPALFYFTEHDWFNVIIVFEEKDYFYYCNIGSPFKWVRNELQYIDYDIDVIVRSDYTYEIVDRDEFVENKKMYNYPDSVKNEVNRAIEQVEKLIRSRKGPFAKSFVAKWAEEFTR